MEEQFKALPTFFILLLAMSVRYFALSGFFYWLCGRTSRPAISPRSRTAKQNRQDIKWSLISSCIFAASGTLLIFLWASGQTQIYLGAYEFGSMYFLLSLPLYLILHDTYYYWVHRLLHQGKLYSKVHWVHHSSVVPTAWTSFAFHPVEALLQAIFLPVIVVLIPIHWSLLILFLGLMTLFGVLNHLGHEFYPAFFERPLRMITATHHQLHHERPMKNFGLYFTWWDQFMGTEGGRDE